MAVGSYRFGGYFQDFVFVGFGKFLVQRVPGVADDVDKDLLDFVGLGFNVRQVVWKIGVDGSAGNDKLYYYDNCQWLLAF